MLEKLRVTALTDVYCMLQESDSFLRNECQMHQHSMVKAFSDSAGASMACQAVGAMCGTAGLKKVANIEIIRG